MSIVVPQSFVADTVSTWAEGGKAENMGIAAPQSYVADTVSAWAEDGKAYPQPDGGPLTETIFR